MALSAAAIGLGNVWRFAYLLGENGGAPFMLAYIVALLLVATPVMVAEVVVGHLGRGSPWASLRGTAKTEQRSGLWALLAPLAITTAFILLVGSVLVAGWSLAFAFHHQLGSFAAISLSGTQLFFEQLLESPQRSLGWLTLAMLPLLASAAAGIRRGVAALMWVCVPLLFVLFAVLISFAVEYGDLEATGRFLFARQELDFTTRSFMQAFSQAIYTLGIGVGVGMTFGAYAPGGLPLCRSVLAVALFDVVVAVAVAVAIFPLLFANNLEPAQGLGLLFIALPYSFGNLGFGDFYGTLFFFAIYVVSLATAVALLEPLLSTLQHRGINRVRASVMAVGVLWMMAWLSLQSLAPDSSLYGLFDYMESLATLVLLPASALGVALYVGWRLPRSTLRAALLREPDILFSLWYFLLRFVVPPAIILVALWVYRAGGW